MLSTFTARSALLAFGLLVVAACGPKPNDAAFMNRGGPESLLDVSSEVVNLSVATKSERADLTNWIERDQPTRAELNCALSDKGCSDTQKILEKHNIQVNSGTGANNTVTLVYERILARDCDQRFRNNSRNHYNTNHSAFGCSIAANMVQHVTDKQEFINPALSDDPSAVRAVTDYRRAYSPRKVIDMYDVGESVVGKSKTQ